MANAPNDPSDADVASDTSDQRRARMGDVLALRAKVEALTDRLTDLEAHRAAGRMSKADFIGHFLPALAASGRKANLWRQECEQAWSAYNDLLDGKAMPTVEEIYGGSNVGRDVHAPLEIRAAPIPMTLG